MARTIAQVRNRALEMLGKIAIGQTPAADIASDMESVYNQIYARLELQDLVTWSSTGDIPDEFVEDITALMAFERSEGIPESRYIRIRDAAARAMPTITSNVQGRWTNPREYTDY